MDSMEAVNRRKACRSIFLKVTVIKKYLLTEPSLFLFRVV